MSSGLRVAARAAGTTVEGPYRRFAIWVQGCTLRCPGCCNPDMFEPTGGEAVDIGALLTEIDNVRDEIEGITVLGGEPLEQMSAVAQLARAAAARGLGILVSTGLTFTEARAKPGFDGLWGSIDTLVTGRFVARHPEPRGGRAFIGSSNQRLLHRSTRYRDPRLWLGPPAAEVVLDAHGGARVLGAPALVKTVRRRLAAS